MVTSDNATFEQSEHRDLDRPTLIEGLPGHGLLASIAVEQITDQLGLDLYGTLFDETFPQGITFEEGMARDPVRVYAGKDPAILTLQSALAIPYLSGAGAAQAVIETGLEPLVEFDIDTTELENQATDIQERMQQIAEQYQELLEGDSQHPEAGMPGMYQ